MVDSGRSRLPPQSVPEDEELSESIIRPMHRRSSSAGDTGGMVGLSGRSYNGSLERGDLASALALESGRPTAGSDAWSSAYSEPSRSSNTSGLGYRPSDRSSVLSTSPPLPEDSTVTAEDVIRESMASSRSTALYADQMDLTLTRRSDALSMSMSGRSDSFAFSFSSRGTFRRSTLSEQTFRESELFEPERELSDEDLSNVLKARTGDSKLLEVTSIKEEDEEAVKYENAKSRWAQHVKLKAQNFLYSTMSGKTPSPPTKAHDAPVAASPEAQEWAEKQKAILSKSGETGGFDLPIPFAGKNVVGMAKFQKWNRWMHDQYQSNIGKVVQRAFKDEIQIGGEKIDPKVLIAIEEVVKNPRMMRYYAAWLQTTHDESKLFFLASFEEYRQFWCTLRSNYQEQDASVASSRSGVHFSKDDALLVRSFGVKIAQKYLTKSAPFHIGFDLVNSDVLRAIKRDLATGGDPSLRAFDRVATKVKREMMETFSQFRTSELYAEMLSSIDREVICLEDMLMNQRLAHFFWVFLFQHDYHRELALWVEIEYDFKPAYRQYMTLLKSSNRRKDQYEQAAYLCRKLLRYISAKYYPGDDDMKRLDKSLSTSCAKLQKEQDDILARFSLIHLELYQRFITSRAYAEFALYKTPSADQDESIDDPMRLSQLLLEYGLRAHHWPDASRENLKKRSLEVLHTARGYEALCGVLTFEGILVQDKIELKLRQHPLAHDPSPLTIDKSIKKFLVPWSEEEEVVLQAPSCPPPLAFNFRMGDGSDDMFAATVVMYKPAPLLTKAQMENEKLDPEKGSRWIPYGVCMISKFPLVELLRERVAEAYEFILELETIAATKEQKGSGPGSYPNFILESSTEPFRLDKKLVSKLSRSVSADSISRFHQATPVALASASPQSCMSLQTSTSMLTTLPRLDYSIRLLFDSLDVPTVLTAFTSILLESRVLIISSYYSVVMKVCETLRALVYPLLWPHVFLPMLPKELLQYLECPTPFIIGVARGLLDEETMDDVLNDDVVVLDLDKGRIVSGEMPCPLPTSVQDVLKESLFECLKPNVSKSDHVFADHFPTKPHAFPEIAVRRLFYRAVRSLIGEYGYYRYVWTDEYSKQRTVFFDEASYLAASPVDMRDFRTLFIATQAFSEYIVSYYGFEDEIATVRRVEKRSSSSGASPKRT